MEDNNVELQPQSPQQPTSKKNKAPAFSKFALFILITFIVWWFNNCTIKTVTEEITSDKIKNKVEIAVISDFHAIDAPFAITANRVISEVEDIEPDFVCVLGDMHSLNASEKEKNISLNLMKDILALDIPLYFVLGEHDDRTNEYVAKMEANGINVLDGEKETIKVKDTEISIYGISNAYFSPSFDLTNEFNIKKDEYNILMAHIPMYEAYEKFGADLTLCGDTHGGIIQLPLLGPAYFDDMILPQIFSDGEVYDKGLFDYNGGKMFITSGVGNSIKGKYAPVRFWNRPEIAHITLCPEKD